MPFSQWAVDTETTVRRHKTATRRPTTEGQDHVLVNRDTCSTAESTTNGTALLKNYLAVSRKLFHPYKLAIPLLGIYPRQLTPRTHVKIFTPAFSV